MWEEGNSCVPDTHSDLSVATPPPAEDLVCQVFALRAEQVCMRVCMCVCFILYSGNLHVISAVFPAHETAPVLEFRQKPCDRLADRRYKSVLQR